LRRNPKMRKWSLILIGLFLIMMIVPLLPSIMPIPAEETLPINSTTNLSSKTIDYEWWDASWDYRIGVDINSTVHYRFDQMIEQTINFTDLFKRLNVQGNPELDVNSIRVVEYNSTGSMLVFNQSQSGTNKYVVPSLFDPIWNFDKVSNACGKVAWIMNGTTQLNQNRTYYIYFDTDLKPTPTINFYGTDLIPNDMPEVIFSAQNTRIWGFNGTSPMSNDPQYYAFRSNDYGNWWALGEALGDVDNDGAVELITSTYNAHGFYVFGYNTSESDPNKRLIQEFSSGDLGANTYTIETGDVDNDGTREIVVSLWSPIYRLYIFGWNGSTYVKEGETEYLNPGILRFALGDVDQDGVMEIIGGRWSSGSYARFYVYGFTGVSYVREYESGDLGQYITGIAAADLDNDGNIEILIGTYGDDTYGAYMGTMHVFEYIKALESSWPDPPYALEYKYPTAIGFYVIPSDIADWDNDGTLEIAVGTYQQPNRVRPALVYVFNFTDGMLQEEWRSNATELGTDYYMMAPKFADLNKDGIMDLTVGSNYGFIRIYNHLSSNIVYTSNDFGTNVGCWADTLIISSVRNFHECPTLITPPAISMTNPEVKKAIFTVRTLDVDNNVIPDLSVYIDNGTYVWTDITDETGICTFEDFPEGTYNITVNFTTVVNPTTSYTVTVNSSTNLDIQWATSTPEMNMSCDIARFIFNVTDIDGAPVTPGWLLIGNSTMLLDNITLDSSGMATFRWVNSSNTLYNFSVYYQSNGYLDSPLLVNSSELKNTVANRTTVQNIKTDLTTLDIWVIDDIGDALEAATVQIRSLNATPALVELKTDVNGLVTFRWLKAEVPNNYTIYILMRGEAKEINITIFQQPGWHDSFNFTLTNKNQYGDNLTVTVNWNTSRYLSSLEKINPSYTITAIKNSLVTIQVQFNTTDLQQMPPTPTPTQASLCSYEVWDTARTTLIEQGQLEYLSWGIHTVTLDTSGSSYSSNAIYYIDVDAFKTGYQAAPMKTFLLTLVDSPVIFEANEGETSAIQAIWTETKTVQLTYNSSIPESIQIEGTHTSLTNNTGNAILNTYVSALTNEWNLTSVTFNFSNIWASGVLVNFPSLNKMNVTYGGQKYPVIDSVVGSGYCEIPEGELNLYGAVHSFGVEAIGLENYSVSYTAHWARYFARTITQLSNTNLTNIVLDGTNDYRNINYLKFEFSNIRDSTNSLINASDAFMNLSIPDNQGTIVNILTGAENGTGILELTNLNLYPTCSFPFVLNYTNVKSYNCNITAGYMSVFTTHRSLEQKSTTSEAQTITVPNTVDIPMPMNTWDLTSLYLQFDNLINTSGNAEHFYPSENNLAVSYMGSTYHVFDIDNGSGYIQIPISTSDGGAIFSFNVTGNFDFQYDLTIAKAYSNDQISPISDANITWVAEIPTVTGSCPENGSVLGQYQLTFNTTQMDAGEWGASSGNHYLRVTATKESYQTDETMITFDVRKVDTTLNGSKTNYDTVDFTVTYENYITYHYVDEFGNDVENADSSIYEWEMSNNPAINGTGELTEAGNGYYVLDFNTANLAIGGYDIVIELSKDNYRSKIAGIHLNIISIATNATPDNVRLEPEKGTIVAFTIPYIDIIKSEMIANATTALTGLPSSSYTIQESPSGYYVITIDTQHLSLTTYDITFTLSKDNYTAKNVNLLLVVKEKTIFGIPMSWFYIIIGTVVAVVAVFGAYAAVKHARIPFVIKKIDETLNIIEKEKPNASVPVTKSKSALFEKLFKSEWATVGLSPPLIEKSKGLDSFLEVLIGSNIKLSSSEAQKLMEELQSLSREDGIAKLKNMGIPPGMCERLYNVAKVGKEFKGIKQ